jgi:hypothetical protein
VTEARIRASDQHITGENEVKTATGTRSIDRGDCRCREVPDTVDDLSAETSVGCARHHVESGDFAKMGASEEDARVARAEDQRP